MNAQQQLHDLMDFRSVRLVTHTVTEQTSQAIFADTNTDLALNPHVNQNAAKRYGFDALLVSAPELLTVVEAALHSVFGPGWLTSGEVALRFVSPVLAGTELALTARRVEDSQPGMLSVDLRMTVTGASPGAKPVCTGSASVLPPKLHP